MHPSPPEVEPAPALRDAWAPGAPIPLTGPLERARFPAWVTAVLAVILGLVVYQGITTVLVIGLLLGSGADVSAFGTDLAGMIEQFAREFLIANSIGQVFGLLVVGILLARLHTPRAAPFLRFRRVDWGLLGLSVVGLFALMPVVQWLSGLGRWIPQPEFLEEQEALQQVLIESVLAGDLSILFSLAVIAVTPAFCEEIFFRGYAQRQFERSAGVMWGIVLSGVVFGLFHLRLTEALPLSVLGIYLAYLAWRTGSLWAPIVVHFVNNGFAVLAAAYVRSRPDLDLADIEELTVPWYVALLGFAVFAAVIAAIRARAQRLLAAVPAPPPEPTSPIPTHE
ncbi:MAG: CPBP family intramembrane glutamic endopeptidase [Rhodothermales bacterium]|nr:CPBP family intramembrane glutamic endopeptidase [Rhodothermales bacterium]